MPNPLSQGDQELYGRIILFVESLIYAANYNYMSQPGNQGLRLRRRKAFVDRLRELLRPLIPTSHSVNTSDSYSEMRSLINLVRTTITDKFMDGNPADRKTVVDKFVADLSPVLVELNCGDLCLDKEKGCVEC